MSETDSSLPASQFSYHLKATLVLGLPIVGAHLAQMAIGVTDTIMMGWLGTEELAAGTLAGQSYFLLMILGLGFGGAMTPLIGNALGRNDPIAVRRVTRMGLWALIGMSILFLIPLIFIRQILLAVGQKPDIVDLADTYMTIAKWSMVPAFVQVGLRAFLTSIEKANAVLIITLLTAVLNGFLNYALIFGNFGAPRLELEGAAWATVITNLLGAAGTIIYLQYCDAAKPYTLFVRVWRSDWQALLSVTKLGLPISLSIFAEAGMFSATSVMIGWLGAVALAAHGIALQVASVTFMVPLGFAVAASVRISNAAGRGDKAAIGLASRAVVLLGFGFSFLAALAFWLMPEPLIDLFIDRTNPDYDLIIAYAVPLLFMAAAFQLFDAMQVSMAGCLRGLQDTKIPFYIALVSYWGIGMTTAYVFGITLGYGGTGIWGGLVAGLAIAGIGLAHRFYRREQLGLV